MGATKKTLATLGKLMQHEGAFVMGLFVMRAVLRPYAHLLHDAALYSVQVMNHVQPGFFQDDLFFKYGSQDSFSTFSHWMLPLVAALGLRWGFVLAYCVASIAIIWAEVRIVGRLIPQRHWAAVAAVLAVMNDIPYGNCSTFVLHEGFLTARLPAVALSLWALERTLSHCYKSAFCLGLVAMSIHPLMGIGGLAIVLGDGLLRGRSVRFAIVTGGALAVLVAGLTGFVLQTGYSFSVMNPQWFQLSREISPHCFLSTWSLSSYMRLVATLAISGTACWYLPVAHRRLVILAIVLAVGSLALTGLGELTRFAILLQVQAYRGLWVLQWLSVPLAGVLIVRLLRSSEAWKIALAWWIFFFLMDPFADGVFVFEGLPQHVLLLAVHWGAWTVAVRGMVSASLDGNRLAIGREANQPTAAALLGTGSRTTVLWRAAFLAVVSIAAQSSVEALPAFIQIAKLHGEGPIMFWIQYSRFLPLAVVASMALLGIHGQLQAVSRSGRGAVCLGGIGLLIIAMDVAYYGSDAYRSRYAWHQRDYAAILKVLESQSRDARSAIEPDRSHSVAQTQIYWPVEPNDLWFELHSNSYLSWAQVQGAIFSNEICVEGKRRALLVRRFEFSHAGANKHVRRAPERILRFYEASPEMAEPTRTDLFALAADRELDWIVVPNRFEGLYAARSGSYYLYNCHQLRDVASHSEHRDGMPF